MQKLVEAVGSLCTLEKVLNYLPECQTTVVRNGNVFCAGWERGQDRYCGIVDTARGGLSQETKHFSTPVEATYHHKCEVNVGEYLLRQSVFVESQRRGQQFTSFHFQRAQSPREDGVRTTLVIRPNRSLGQNTDFLRSYPNAAGVVIDFAQPDIASISTYGQNRSNRIATRLQIEELFGIDAICLKGTPLTDKGKKST